MEARVIGIGVFFIAEPPPDRRWGGKAEDTWPILFFFYPELLPGFDTSSPQPFFSSFIRASPQARVCSLVGQNLACGEPPCS